MSLENINTELFAEEKHFTSLRQLRDWLDGLTHYQLDAMPDPVEEYTVSVVETPFHINVVDGELVGDFYFRISPAKGD